MTEADARAEGSTWGGGSWYTVQIEDDEANLDFGRSDGEVSAPTPLTAAPEWEQRIRDAREDEPKDDEGERETR